MGPVREVAASRVGRRSVVGPFVVPFVRRAGALLAVLVVAPLVGFGCGPSPDAGAGAPEPAERSATARSVTGERGPVRVTVALDPGAPLLSDEPELTVTVDAAEGVRVDAPPFLDAIPGFVVRSFREDPPELRDGRRVDRQRYRLEPEETGGFEIPAVTVTFHDDRADGDGAAHEVATDPLPVEVASMIGADAPSLADLRGPRAPREIEAPRGSTVRRWWIGAVLAAVAVAVALLLRRGRRAAAGPAAPTRTPTELAAQELERLLADDPLARGELNSFFVELTAVVRRYIERTTGVRAPEQTTEEFLREMGAHAVFDAATRTRLREFLESADLVKFARAVPGGGEIEASFRLAQEFVGLPGTMTLRGRAA